MFEIIVIVAACVAMYRIADSDGLSPWAWVGITLALCVASFVIPLPLVRVAVAAVLAFVGMIAYKVVANR